MRARNRIFPAYSRNADIKTMEVQRHQEQTPLKITPVQVRERFNTYQQESQKDATEEERLTLYRGVVQGVAEYFGQKQIASLPTPEQKTLVRDLFYEHSQTASVPIDFFLDAKNKLVHEVLDDGNIQSGTTRWKHEVELIKGLAEVELQEVVGAERAETRDRKAIEELARKNAEPETDEAVRVTTQANAKRLQEIQQKAIEILGTEDQELAEDLRMRDTTVAALSDFVLHFDPEKAEAVVGEHARLLDDADMILGEIRRRAFYGQDEQVRAIVSTTAQRIAGPDFIWNLWTKNGHIPPHLTNSLEEIVTMSELAETAQSVEGLDASAKARHLVPFIQKGVSAVLLSEIVQGRYEFPDNFLAAQVDAFIHFYDRHTEEKTKSGMSAKQKIILGALVASVLAVPADRYFARPPAPLEKVDALVQNLGEEELRELRKTEIKIQENKTKKALQESARTGSESAGIEASAGTDTAGRAGTAGGLEGGGRGPLEFQSGAGTSKEPDTIKPDNGSPEDIERAQKTIVWNLEGEKLWQYYRTHTATDFSKKEWKVQKWSGGRGWTISPNMPTEKQLTRTLRISGGTAELPMPDDHLLTAGVKVEVEGKSEEIYSIQQRAGGTYHLVLREGFEGKTVTISYGLGRARGSIIPKADDLDIRDMGQKLIEMDSLPPDVKKFMEDLRTRTDLSPVAKAKIIEKYVQTEFTYSLIPEWSDFYAQGATNADFVRRVLQVKKTDCDVANTALIALLRLQGIPSRMVFGYAHSGTFNPNEKTLTAAEGHGWTEAYIDGEWVTLDATPATPDEYTRQALEKLVSPSQLSGMAQHEKLVRQIESVKAFTAEHPTESVLLLWELINLGSLGASILLRRKNYHMASQMAEELIARVNKYVDDPNGTDIADRLTQREFGKIKQGLADRQPVWSLLFPFGIISLMKDIDRSSTLSGVPYTTPNTSVARSDEPNAEEFLHKVLGYERGEVQRMLYTDAYRETKRQLDAGRSAVLNRLQKDSQNKSLPRQVAASLDGFLDKDIPRELAELLKREKLDTAAWDERKASAIGELFARYRRALAEGERMLAGRRGKGRYRQTKVMGRTYLNAQDFAEMIDDLVMFELLRMQAEDAYKSASIDNALN